MFRVKRYKKRIGQKYLSSSIQRTNEVFFAFRLHQFSFVRSAAVAATRRYNEAKEVFDLFDFWDGRDGEVDAFKLGDLFRCLGHNPTLAIVENNGGTKKMGEKGYKFEEFLPLYQEILKEKDTGTYADFMEAFKTFDREGQGYISSAEMRHVLTYRGERLTDREVDDLFKYIDLTEDLEGNVKYEECVQKVMAGPN